MNMTRTTVALDSLHANPWNPNRQPDHVLRATGESLATFGWIDPVTCRPHPDLDGQYQIVNGEHRWRAAQLLGWSEPVPVVVIDPCPDHVAKKLTVVLNEVKGQPDPSDLAALLASLGGDYGDDLRVALPYTDDEWSTLLGGDDWQERLQPDGEVTVWRSVVAKLPADALDVWLQARGRVEEAGPLHADEAIANGQALERLAAEYLAS